MSTWTVDEARGANGWEFAHLYPNGALGAVASVATTGSVVTGRLSTASAGATFV
ncbi:hypothetical protein MPY17_39585 (plasmid) [Rhodococcus opacus]|uniref:hypothetical protein n=1 Tax=Rhodococcus opacus TaxID=37919 RepID=UPI001FF56FC5|nr:hypothetical protein [Rhodococcus opacus]UOT08501.1 hypothetical protein MPY17_39585 [Rhodococcus opacus]